MLFVLNGDANIDKYLLKNNIYLSNNSPFRGMTYGASFSISWHRLLCHSLVRQVLMATIG
jgi:hypothetical protein